MENEASAGKKNKSGFHISTNIDFTIRSPKIKAALLIACLIFGTVFAGYHVYQATDDSMLEIETVTAKKTEYVRTVNARAFVLRDESYIQGAGSAGHVVPIVSDGTKVSGNDNVVNIFKTAEEAQVYYDLQDIQTDIEYYQTIQNTAAVGSLADISAYDEKVEAGIYSLLDVIEKCDVQNLSEATNSLRSAVTRKSIAVGNVVDVSPVLTALFSERTQLQNRQSGYSSIAAEVAGYYVQSADGYEFPCGAYSGFSFAKDVTKITKNVKKLDCTTIERLLELQPIPVTAAYGKLITGFIWYLVCNVPGGEVADLYIGQRLKVSFPDEQAGSIEVKVAAMNADGEGNTALILSATAMDANYANLRKTNIVIHLETYTGFRVEQTALRVVDNQTGVYVLLGNVVRFRAVTPIYSDENFHIVDAGGESGYIQAFDEIILGGADLYDGKLVQ